MDRLTKRRIGDDANLIRRFPKLEGRIQSVAIRRDGSALAAASSLDGRGQICVYAYDEMDDAACAVDQAPDTAGVVAMADEANCWTDDLDAALS